MMDQALFPGNYHDYPDDDVAIQREVEIGESIAGYHIDDIFPPNARSLYFDPLNPPKGSIPNESIKWFRICEGDLLNCEKPVLFQDDLKSCQIQQGALGDKYLIAAMSLLSCDMKYLKRLIVSTKYAEKGLYTLKFYKAGKWRYVHIDDYIPCRQSGKVHFCRNANPNETFAMLIEKAYAKLHGCYEALSYGLIEKVVQDLTPASGAECLRIDRFSKRTVCDDIWEKVEKSLATGSLVGVGRFVEDAFAENPNQRQGITLGQLYQVIDMQVVTADPTEDFDALTIGMVCIRNLQNDVGKFIGRWSYGHSLWLDYKQIANDLAERTKQIQKDRGLQTEDKNNKFSKHNNNNANKLAFMKFDDMNAGDEPDSLDNRYISKGLSDKMVQPQAEDLYWIQIEDFVEIFNRIYIITDVSFREKATCKRFLSRWLPGDFIAGSGGPPVVIKREIIEEEEELDEEGNPIEKDPNEIRPIQYRKIPVINEMFTDNPMYPFAVTEPTTMIITLYQLDKRWNANGRFGSDPTKVLSSSFISRKERLEQVMKYSIGLGFLLVRLSGLKIRLTEFRLKKIAYTSECIAFSHTTSAVIHLYPGRYAIIPFTHCNLDAAMEYCVHAQYISSHIEWEIEDVIAQRLQDKEPSDDGNPPAGSPGDYDEDEIEPEDNDLLVIHNHERNDQSIEQDIEEIQLANSPEKHFIQKTNVIQKNPSNPSSTAPSISGGNNNNNNNNKQAPPPGNNPQAILDYENEHVQIVTDNVSILSYEKQHQHRGGGSVGDDNESQSQSLSTVEPMRPMVPLPRLFFVRPWEYQDDMEELSMTHLYLEVNEMMKYVRTLKGEIRKLHTQMKATQETETSNMPSKEKK